MKYEVNQIFKDGKFRDWCFFVVALLFFAGVHRLIMVWPSESKYHCAALFIWILLAVGFLVVHVYSMDPRGHENLAVDWVVGYLLEFIFSIENVFIYHVVCKAFHMPRAQCQKALFLVVIFQILFQLLFFCGLAHWLVSVRILPYLLGLWLLYVAYHSLDLEEGEEPNLCEVEVDINREIPLVARYFQVTFPENFTPVYRETSVVTCDSGRPTFTLLAPAVLSLLLVDFLMEIDVTLTKIEAIENSFVAFTSSMAAAFAVPELFFVARDLFQQFRYLKYGVTFVLFFYGVQLLLHRWLRISDVVSILIILVAMFLGIVVSAMIPEQARGKCPKAVPNESNNRSADEKLPNEDNVEEGRK